MTDEREARTKQVAILFGGAGGIGSALARRLVRAGATVVVVGRTEARLAALAAELPVEPRVADVEDPAAVQAVVAETVARHGRLDAAANCVGSILLRAAHQTSPEQWDETLRKNLSTAFYVVRSVAGAMLAAKTPGAIALLSSAAGRTGLPNHEAIAAAKAGVIGLTLSAAATYAPHGVRVNCVAPGLVRTPLAARITGNEASLKASTAMHPLGRIGEPDDVASALEWLLDPRQSWVTGQVLGVDGGLADLRGKA